MMDHKSAISLIPEDDRYFYQAGLKEMRASCYAHAPLLPTSFFLDSFLREFSCHSLDNQSSAALMDRVDTKFVLPMRSLLEFLVELREDYTILEQSHRRIFSYETTYFDTPGRLFYNSHHNGKLNRNKVRFRHYQDSNTGFMEVKLKTNKDRTVKKRMPLSPQKPDFSGTKQFLSQSLDQRINRLETALLVNYQRITLMNKHRSERLTLDLALSFKAFPHEPSSRAPLEVSLPQMWIAELKRDRKASESSFVRLIKKHQIDPISFSKYCIGSALTNNKNLKTNQFKPVLRRISHLTKIEKRDAKPSSIVTIC